MSMQKIFGNTVRFKPNLTVALVGATGAVGTEILRCLESRSFPIHTIHLLASKRSSGKTCNFRGQTAAIRCIAEDSFVGVDLSFFAASSSVSKEFVPIAVDSGSLVIDNSSAFRLDSDVPLVVPEVNSGELALHRGIIANPNCVAAIMTVALAPLRQLGGLKRLNVSTYQAASGAGAAGMEELKLATRAYLQNMEYSPKVFPHPYAFNLFSHNSEIDLESGYNGEELKVIAETRRILSMPELPINVTCVRVPVLRAHTMSVSITFDRQVDFRKAHALLSLAPGVRLVDDPSDNRFPMPHEASGVDDVFVGRVRMDISDPSRKTLSLLIVGDQLLKGAALNAVQIAEALNFHK